MSLNIGKDLLDYATGIKVTIDTEKFGPRQLTSFNRMLKTGNIKGWSGPALVARLLRRTEGLPYFHFGRYSNVHFANATPEMVEHLTAAIVALRMAPDWATAPTYRRQYVNELDSRLTAGDRHGSIWYTTDAFKAVLTQCKVPEFTGAVPRYVEVEMLDKTVPQIY